MKCNNCGHEMTNAAGRTLIGLNLRVSPDDDHQEAIRFRQRYGVNEINLCMCCVMQGLHMRRSTYTERV